ncbi:MAG: molecular chaperone TorD family protein, partial [Synergistaceae bacterium]|nr:molecular chaperone TorD family protein [Synergistaceae bacterium]
MEMNIPRSTKFESFFAFFADFFLNSAEEHHALLSGLSFPSLELWESCYIPENDKGEKRLLNRVTRDVAAMYREAGLAVDESFRQPPDHIGVECAFFSWLCG